MLTRSPRAATLVKAVFGLLAFVVTSFTILNRPDWALLDFDQVFYVAIAYDLDTYGVFSNGILEPVDSAGTKPRPGMFFGPVFPAIVLVTMKLDSRFAEAVRCSVEADRGHRDERTCEAYELPIRILNALFLALGVIAVMSAAELIFRSERWLFAVSGLLAIAALTAEAEIFSYVMTESTIFALYSIFSWAFLRGLITGRTGSFAVAGFFLGLLCLTKPSFLALFPLAALMTLYCGFKISRTPRRLIYANVLIVISAFTCVILPWMARNYLSVGKLGFTEEYGSAALVERLAYDDMTGREYISMFPYCLPGIGDVLFDKVYGTDSMHRFVFHTPGSFFHVGRDRREALVQKYGRLDRVIGRIAHAEMRANWWRYLLVNIPLAWCGMWPGGLATLLLLPLFVWSLVRAVRTREPLLVLYAAPAMMMLGLHAAVGNHYTRYNLILIGPYSVGAAWIIWSALPYAHWRSRFRVLGR